MTNQTINQELLKNACLDFDREVGKEIVMPERRRKLLALHDRELAFMMDGNNFDDIMLLEGTGDTYEERAECRAILMDCLGYPK